MANRLKKPTNKWQRFLVDGVKDAEANVRYYKGLIKLCSPGSISYRNHMDTLNTAEKALEKAKQNYETQWDEPWIEREDDDEGNNQA